MLSVEEAQSQVLEEVPVVETERVPIAHAAGRVLREDVAAPRDLPPDDNSAMDGYAVHAADVADATREHPVRLKVTGDVAAGHPAATVVEPGRGAQDRHEMLSPRVDGVLSSSYCA